MIASLSAFSFCRPGKSWLTPYYASFLIVIFITGCSTAKYEAGDVFASHAPVAAFEPSPVPESASAQVAAPVKALAPALVAAPAPKPSAVPESPMLRDHNVAYFAERAASFASKLPPRKAKPKGDMNMRGDDVRKAEGKVAEINHLSAPNKIDKFEKVRAELAATPVITTPGPPGDLRVWIGDTNHESNFPPGMNSASAIITTSVKPQTVLVTPNAPAFNVEPQNECQRFDPTGTTANFHLTPKFERDETYPVGARIEIFDQDSCKGDPTPKAAADISVRVAVRLGPDDIPKLIRENIYKLLAGLFSLIVGFMLFKARKYLKEKFGFEDKGS